LSVEERVNAISTVHPQLIEKFQMMH